MDPVKAGVNMKAVLWLGIMVLTQISCSRFNESKISLLHTYLRFGLFCNFLGIFGDKQFFSKVVKFMEMRNVEDLILF